MKYVIKTGEQEALYKQNKLVMFDSKEQAEPVASALDAKVLEVVPFGDSWISLDHFEQIDHKDLMDIFETSKEE